MPAPSPSLALILGLVLLGLAAPVAAQDNDRDGDGLSDFHEINKYRTDPERSDSDGDGVLDGDWPERREYQYYVRSVVQVMRPVTPELLCDDYQDVRVLDETDEYVELEVVHYPFNSVDQAIAGVAGWRKTAREMKVWLEPGPTADWTPVLAREIEAFLAEAGIAAGRLDDRQLCERASKALLERAHVEDGFTTFITAFDENGRPHVPEPLRTAAEGGALAGRALEEQWAREISAAGMFRHRLRGSCTSSAIYLNGCLRALGLPTRLVLCIPVVDASDAREIAMIRRGITHPEVRKTMLAGLAGAEGSWTSHTFNEVWVGGRWRRLNYDRLGQNILDADYLGLMTHVATFSDWADARMSDTIGHWQGSLPRSGVFKGANPYSCLSLRDAFGPHCALARPANRMLTVRRVHWFDAKELPQDVRAGLGPRDRRGLVAEITGHADAVELRAILATADCGARLETEEHPDVALSFEPGCWWQKDEQGCAYVWIRFVSREADELPAGVRYRFVPRNEDNGQVWVVGEAAAEVERR